MAKLTMRTIERLDAPPAERGPRDVPDGQLPGLYLSIKPSGVRSWCVRYRFAGRQRRYTIGRSDAIDVAEARKRARKVLNKVDEGIDPQAEKLAQRAGDVTDAFPDLAIKFIETYAKPRNRTWRDQARVLGLKAGPHSRRNPAIDPHWKIIPGSPAARWRTRAVRTITKREVTEAVDAALVRGPIAANKVYATLSRFFGWLVERGILDASPVVGTKAPSPISTRERTPNAAELSLIWDAAGELDEPFKTFVRMLILTGQRRSEVAGMARGELNGRIWTIPKERAKNDEEHELPLSRAAADLLASRPAKGLLFTTTGNTPISGFSKMKIALDEALHSINNGEAIEPWTLHDIRRGVATGLASIGIPPHVVEAVLNHKSGVIKGVAKIYNKHPYFDEKADALERWAKHIAESRVFG
jgi:integrase